MKRLSKEVVETLLRNNFIKRGGAFFRIYGDGVVQIIKYEYERNGDVPYVLSLGLTSMYSELSDSWFTSSGCPLKYEVVNVCGIREASTGTDQEQILICDAIPWLNKLSSQRHLIDGLCFLETIQYQKVYWLESSKIAPYLICHEYAYAEQVVKSILRQHRSGQNNLKDFLPKRLFEQKMNYLDKEDYGLLTILSIIQSRDTVRIRHYLDQNLFENCGVVRKKLGRNACAEYCDYA